ncbi:superoxide dismutase [Clohesyomyces aquaticus]|uniref:superoxide dismutase n=1 Tax=Clohesyomyces aquaticus TaxID=1231657 RepID=A0A1Y1ZGS9_9PLEO|nr:superoxide dismutase [Clohesyomyces aquaticus]
MHIFGPFAFLLAARALAQTTGMLGDAMVITNNPPGARYTAMFKGKGMNSTKGVVTAVSGKDGKGVSFTLMLQGLPKDGGPYSYHLHDRPVPTDGNCTGTMGHLDPYKRTQSPACNMTMPQTCEVGDLSGKHGKIVGPRESKSFVDWYAALVPDTGAFFGNRSIVVHYANSTRLACANFTMDMPMCMPGEDCEG